MSIYNRFMWLALLCSLFGLSAGQSYAQMKNLTTTLFTTNGYNYRIRPLIDQTDHISVYTAFHLMTINSVDEVTETLKTTGYLKLYWKDEFLTWTASDYGNIPVFFWPQNEVWKPDVTLKNSYNEYKQLGHSSLNVLVYADGTIRWAPFQVFESTCAIDITYFPFDTQSCTMEFVAWSYFKEQVHMEADETETGVVLDQFEKNSAWSIASTSWHEVEETDETSIKFTINLNRKPLYNMLTLVFPIITLAILNLLVFVLPCESGEKAGYAVTVFLAFAVFLTIMEASFPQNSETIAIFAIYVVIETVQSTIITFIALLMVRVSTFGEETPIPKWLITLARFSKCRPCREKRRKNIVHVSQHGSDTKIIKNDGNDLKKKVNLEFPVEEMTEKVYTWKYIVNALDMFCFVFFLVFFVVSTLVCLLIPSFNRN